MPQEVQVSDYGLTLQFDDDWSDQEIGDYIRQNRQRFEQMPSVRGYRKEQASRALASGIGQHTSPAEEPTWGPFATPHSLRTYEQHANFFGVPPSPKQKKQVPTQALLESLNKRLDSNIYAYPSLPRTEAENREALLPIRPKSRATGWQAATPPEEDTSVVGRAKAASDTLYRATLGIPQGMLSALQFAVQDAHPDPVLEQENYKATEALRKMSLLQRIHALSGQMPRNIGLPATERARQEMDQKQLSGLAGAVSDTSAHVLTDPSILLLGGLNALAEAGIGGLAAQRALAGVDAAFAAQALLSASDTSDPYKNTISLLMGGLGAAGAGRRVGHANDIARRQRIQDRINQINAVESLRPQRAQAQMPLGMSQPDSVQPEAQSVTPRAPQTDFRQPQGNVDAGQAGVSRRTMAQRSEALLNQQEQQRLDAIAARKQPTLVAETTPAPSEQTSLEKSSRLPANQVFYRMTDGQGRLVTTLTEPYDGSPQDMQRAHADLKRRAMQIADQRAAARGASGTQVEDYSNVMSKAGATNAEGNPSHVIAPNGTIAKVNTKDARYIWGDLSATPKEPRQATRTPKQSAPEPAPDAPLLHPHQETAISPSPVAENAVKEPSARTGRQPSQGAHGEAGRTVSVEDVQREYGDSGASLARAWEEYKGAIPADLMETARAITELSRDKPSVPHLAEAMQYHHAPSFAQYIHDALAKTKEIYQGKDLELALRGDRALVERVIAVNNAREHPQAIPPEVLADYPDLAAKYGKHETAQPARRKPTLGTNEPEFFRAWEQTKAQPGETVIGKDLLNGGEFDWLNGKLRRVEIQRGSRGNVATAREATHAELQGLSDAYNRGMLQVEGRPLAGAGGARRVDGSGNARSVDAMGRTEVYHQATGKAETAPVETSAQPTPGEQMKAAAAKQAEAQQQRARENELSTQAKQYQQRIIDAKTRQEVDRIVNEAEGVFGAEGSGDSPEDRAVSRVQAMRSQVYEKLPNEETPTANVFKRTTPEQGAPERARWEEEAVRLSNQLHQLDTQFTELLAANRRARSEKSKQEIIRKRDELQRQAKSISQRLEELYDIQRKARHDDDVENAPDEASKISTFLGHAGNSPDAGALYSRLEKLVEQEAAKYAFREADAAKARNYAMSHLNRSGRTLSEEMARQWKAQQVIEQVRELPNLPDQVRENIENNLRQGDPAASYENAKRISDQYTASKEAQVKKAEAEAEYKVKQDAEKLRKAEIVSGLANEIKPKPDEVTRIQEAIQKEKIKPASGMTPSQEVYLAGRLKYIAKQFMSIADTPKEEISPVRIEVPGDGAFSVASAEQANNLHYALTGETAIDFLQGEQMRRLTRLDTKPKWDTLGINNIQKAQMQENQQIINEHLSKTNLGIEENVPPPSWAAEKLNQAEANVKARLKKNAGKLTSGIDPQDLVDFATLGAIKLARGVLNAVEWGRQMVAEFGEEIRPHLDDLWVKSHAVFNDEFALQISRKPLRMPESPVFAPEPTGEAAKPVGEAANAQPVQKAPRDATRKAAKPQAETVPQSGTASEAPAISEPHTGAKNAITEKERAERGMTPVERQAYTTVGDAYLTGRDAVESKRVDPRSLAQEVASKPRPLTAEEVGALAFERARLIQEDADVMAKIQELKPDDAAGLNAAKSWQMRVQAEFDMNDQAFVKGGREQSAAFNARKMLLRRDYSRIEVMQRMQVAHAAKPVSPLEEAQVTRLTQEMEQTREAIKANTEAKEAANAQAEKPAETPTQPATKQNRAAQGVSRRGILNEKEQYRVQAALSRLRQAFETPTANLGAKLVGDVLDALVDIGGAYYDALKRTGKVRFKEWAETMRGDVPEDLTDADLQHVWANIKAQTPNEKSPFEPPETFVDELARRVGKEKAAQIANTLQDEQPGLLNKLLNGEALTADEATLIGETYLNTRRTKGTPVQVSAAMKVVSDIANDMRPKVPRTFSPEERAKAQQTQIENRIADMDRRIRENDFSRKTRGITNTPELEALRAKRDALQKQYDALKPPKAPLTQEERLGNYKKNAAQRIQENTERLAGTRPLKPSREALKLDEEGRRLKAQEAQIAGRIERMIAKREFEALPLPQKGLRVAGALVGAQRAMQFGHEMSFFLRQGLFPAMTRPDLAVKSLPEAFRSYGTENQAIQAQHVLEERPNWKNGRYALGEVKFGDIESGSLSQHEEFVASNLINSARERMNEMKPGWKKTALAPARLVAGSSVGSERANTVLINRMRADLFDEMERRALWIRKRFDKNATLEDRDYRAIGDFVNNATGRGSLGKSFDSATGLLNLFLTAPRYYASRLRLLSGTGVLYGGGSMAARAAIASSYAQAIGGVVTILALLKAQGADVETDPVSTDFLRAKSGKVVFDPGAGIPQYSTLIGRLGEGRTVSASGKENLLDSGKFGGQSSQDVAMNFLMGKASPPLRTSLEALQMHHANQQGREATDWQGNPITPKSLAGGLTEPLYAKDVRETLQSEGVPMATAVAIAAYFGIGASVRQTKPQKSEMQKQMEARLERLKPKLPQPPKMKTLQNY